MTKRAGSKTKLVKFLQLQAQKGYNEPGGRDLVPEPEYENREMRRARERAARRGSNVVRIRR